MKLKLFLLISACSISVAATSAAEYYVSPKGKDSNKGSIRSPFATVSRAVKAMQPDDVCYIRGGEYHESIDLSNMHGADGKPLTFSAYKDEDVTFVGTRPITTRWSQFEGNIYQTKIDFPIWQLFVGDKSMISARHPNGNWYDGSVWDSETSMLWPEEGSEKNHFKNSELKEFDCSLADGGMIIVNSSSWGTSVSKITEHKAGDDNFHFDPSTVTYRAHKSNVLDMRYFLEGRREFLDSEGEWFYDTKSGMLYLWAPDGVDPNKLEISGKVQSFAFSGDKVSHVKIHGINFFGTSLSLTSGYDLSVEDCNFLFPTYSKRMLGDIETFDIFELAPDPKGGNIFKTPADFEIVNCRFEYIDGPAITASGDGVLIENCYIAHIDYSCVVGDAAAMFLNNASNLTFRRNTLKYSGASATLQLGGAGQLIELNDISNTGYLQHDGALIQLRVGAADGAIVRNNYLHHSIKVGVRTDNVNKVGFPFGVNATAYNNVSWSVDRGTFFKGDKHFVYNNLVFDNTQRDLIISSNKSINGYNYSTITRNNLCNSFSGHQSAPHENYPIPGTYDHNWVGDDHNSDIRSQLRDPDNMDFRPRKGAEIIDAGALIEGKTLIYNGSKPDIGAYESGDENYWIAGYRSDNASAAVPCNETTTAKIDCDLMWLGAYKADSYKVYFGTSADNLKLISTQKNNICTPPALKSGATYYWRVDCSGERGDSKGDVWSFTVK